MIASSGSSGRHAGNRAGDEKRTWNVTRATKKAIWRENARPPLWKDARETDSRRRRNRRGTPGLEEPPPGHPRAVSRGRRHAPVGRVCRRLQVRPVGTVPRHRGERDRPGLSAHRHSAKALWPIPGSGRGRAAGTTVYHPPSSYQRHHA